jgi:hypothetical protein
LFLTGLGAFFVVGFLLTEAYGYPILFGPLAAAEVLPPLLKPAAVVPLVLVRKLAESVDEIIEEIEAVDDPVDETVEEAANETIVECRLYQDQAAYNFSDNFYLNTTLDRQRRAVGDYTNKHFLQPPLMYPDNLYLFNELNTANPGPDQREFIEYRKAFREGQRQDAALMTSTWTILVKGANPVGIYLIIDHSRHKMKKIQGEMLFTVGSASQGGIDEPFDVNFNDPSVQHTSPDGRDVLPDGGKIPHGIILLNGVGAKTKKIIKLPTTGDVKSPLLLDQILKTFIQTHSIDCVFYCSSSVYDHCELFNELCPKLMRNPPENYMQRDWQGDEAIREPDFSISRCVTHPYPFDPFAFKMTPPSPGVPNGRSCSVGSNFLIADNIQYILPLIPGANEAVEEGEVIEEQGSCSSRHLPTIVYAAVTHAAYKKELQKEMLKMQGTCGLSGNPNSNIKPR